MTLSELMIFFSRIQPLETSPSARSIPNAGFSSVGKTRFIFPGYHARGLKAICIVDGTADAFSYFGVPHPGHVGLSVKGKSGRRKII